MAVQVSFGSCLRIKIDRIVGAIQHLRSFALLAGRSVSHVKRHRCHVLTVGRKQSVDAIYLGSGLKALLEKSRDEFRSMHLKSYENLLHHYNERSIRVQYGGRVGPQGLSRAPGSKWYAD